jgi:hypothetical protein
MYIHVCAYVHGCRLCMSSPVAFFFPQCLSALMVGSWMSCTVWKSSACLYRMVQHVIFESVDGIREGQGKEVVQELLLRVLFWQHAKRGSRDSGTWARHGYSAIQRVLLVRGAAFHAIDGVLFIFFFQANFTFFLAICCRAHVLGKSLLASRTGRVSVDHKGDAQHEATSWWMFLFSLSRFDHKKVVKSTEVRLRLRRFFIR